MQPIGRGLVRRERPIDREQDVIHAQFLYAQQQRRVGPKSAGGDVEVFTEDIPESAAALVVALQDASSIAGLLITTEAMVAELPKKDDMPMGGPPGGGMGGMGGMDF